MPNVSYNLSPKSPDVYKNWKYFAIHLTGVYQYLRFILIKVLLPIWTKYETSLLDGNVTQMVEVWCF